MGYKLASEVKLPKIHCIDKGVNLHFRLEKSHKQPRNPYQTQISIESKFQS